MIAVWIVGAQLLALAVLLQRASGLPGAED